MDEVTQNLTYSNLRILFDWAKDCQSLLNNNVFYNQDYSELMYKINQNLLELFQQLHNAIDRNFVIPQSTMCITNELGNIITHEDNFFEIMGSSNLVNFAQFIDVYAIPNFTLSSENIDNAQATFYKLNYHALERVFTSDNTLIQIKQNVSQQREQFFQRFQLNISIGNFEFTKYDDQNQFFFYDPLYALNEDNIKKLLIVQFVALNYQQSIQLDEFVQSAKFADCIERFYQKLISAVQDE
ncbi:unnamed protein product (macronuclear) [Paramecium tetraurelia]|uniref:Uncharacterized protein n=1 Tax=Paramecium tetraurelia TaxID=5888 RepID=A0BHZ7_PARTE|nr:uncharacterized protein GSPATT00029200001 [Paramecium tetraurelia]CAK58164.1 unnamed protein product [Paramecium tetraurelia]|eukprot:XP_001425562.1 hypothetical protein (macronuclear) [Paramecium tetraurelia strain d4-2]